MENITSVYLKEFDLYDDIFKIKYKDDDMPYSNIKPSGNMVAEILVRLEEIWNDIPTYVANIRQESDITLSCLMLAPKLPHITIPAINRNALFSEKIILPHPMLYYLKLRGPYGPYNMPDSWAEEFMKSTLYICSLRNWISDDIIRLIPSPSQWSNNVNQRVNSFQSEGYLNKEKYEKYNDIIKENEDEFTIDLLNTMDDKLKQFVLEEIKKENLQKYKRIKDELEQQPKYPDWFNVNSNTSSSIFHTGVMLHPIEVKYLISNWNIYIDPLSSISKISLIDNIQTKYNAVNNYLKDVDIAFLKNAPLNYIYDCRKSGLLSDFRKYMLEQYENIRNINDLESFEKVQDIFNKTIDDHVDKLNNEIRTFYSDMLKSVVDIGSNNLGTMYDLERGTISISSIINIAGKLAYKLVPRVRSFTKAKKNPLIVLHKIKK